MEKQNLSTKTMFFLIYVWNKLCVGLAVSLSDKIQVNYVVI